MPTRADAQSYTRFLVSLGVLLCLGAFLGPGLILRDTGTLRVSQHDLNGLPPDARAAMVHRQHVAADFGKWAVWAIPILFAGGVVLIGVGVPRLRRQEAIEQERAHAEKEKAQREVTEQPQEEVDLNRKAEVAQEIAAASSSRQAERPPMRELRRQAADRYLRASRIEEETLKRLRDLAANGDYNFRDHVRFGVPNAYWDIDALLSEERVPPTRADILVEIKAPIQASASAVPEQLHMLSVAVKKYAKTFNVGARGWLVIVADSFSIADAEAAQASAALFEDVATVSLLATDAIDGLKLPTEPTSAEPK